MADSTSYIVTRDEFGNDRVFAGCVDHKSQHTKGNEMSQDALQVLEIIRRTHDTTKLESWLFSELCRATCFYLKGGFRTEQVAKLVIEEIW